MLLIFMPVLKQLYLIPSWSRGKKSQLDFDGGLENSDAVTKTID
jgi:hypothetical protein